MDGYLTVVFTFSGTSDWPDSEKQILGKGKCKSCRMNTLDCNKVCNQNHACMPHACRHFDFILPDKENMEINVL